MIKNLKGTSPGPDQTHYAMIQNLPKYNLRWFWEFYNHIWQKGEFPQPWRHLYSSVNQGMSILLGGPLLFGMGAIAAFIITLVIA